MKTPSRRTICVVAFSFIAGGLWAASRWWEKGLATKLSPPRFSPNGCYRVESFKPFWVLPNVFHRESDPNEDVEPKWLPIWGYPGFYRLYDNRNDELLGESKIYDLEYASGPITWGGGSGKVYAGMIYIGPNTQNCIGDEPAQSKPAQ